MRLLWRIGPGARHGASASSTHSTATTIASSEPPRKKYRPSRAPHRLAHVFSERNIAPARSKWAKYCTFRRAGAKNISRHPTAPHAGAVFLSPQSHPYPTGEKKLALLGSTSAQAGQNSPSTIKTPQNPRFFASRANIVTVSPRIQTCWASFFALMGATDTSQHPPTASPETDDTNAGGSLPQNETTGTSVNSSPHTFETTDTFARTKQPNSGHFPPAKVSRVSCTPRRAPAKASPVSSDAESGLLVHSKALRRPCLLPPWWP